MLTGASGTARLLAFAFYVLAAHELTPSGFGVVRFTITLAMVFFGALQILGTAVSRELGAVRGDEAQTGAIAGSSWSAVLILFAGSSALCVLADVTGLLGAADLVGLMAALFGLTLNQAYFAVARGVGAFPRAAAIDFGGASAQLAAFALLATLFSPSPRMALAVFGFSTLVPILIAEAYRPLIARHTLSVSREALARLWKTGGPLLLGQAFFLIWMTADQVWVERQLGETALGLYGAAKTLGMLFLVLPIATSGVFMPRIAELRTADRDEEAWRMLRLTTVGTAAIAAGVAAVVILLRGPLLELFFGSEYRAAAPAFLWIAVSMVLYTVLFMFTNGLLGWGRSKLTPLALSVAAAVEVGGLVLIDERSLAFPGQVVAASIAVGILAVLIRLAFAPARPRRGPARPAGP